MNLSTKTLRTKLANLPPKWRLRLIGYPIFFGTLFLAAWWILLNPSFGTERILPKAGASATNLKRVVSYLSAMPRNAVDLKGLHQTADHIRREWERLGVVVERQPFATLIGEVENLSVFFGPPTGPRLVIGAHYDTCGNQSGADDNASGVAGITELIRLLKADADSLKRRVEIVAYALEEPPFFATDEMGSVFHARSLKKSGVEVDLMISLEMIGYFSSVAGSQTYPLPLLYLFYPSKGDFIAVVGQWNARGLVRKVKSAFKKHSGVDVYSINAPSAVPGVDLSDHSNYWAEGYPAVMITDTASFRNLNYHTTEDVPASLDYDKMAEIVNGVHGLIQDWK